MQLLQLNVVFVAQPYKIIKLDFFHLLLSRDQELVMHLPGDPVYFLKAQLVGLVLTLKTCLTTRHPGGSWGSGSVWSLCSSAGYNKC